MSDAEIVKILTEAWDASKGAVQTKLTRGERSAVEMWLSGMANNIDSYADGYNNALDDVHEELMATYQSDFDWADVISGSEKSDCLARAAAGHAELATKYAEQAEAAERCEKTRKLLFDLHKAAQETQEADETEYQEWGDNPADR